MLESVLGGSRDARDQRRALIVSTVLKRAQPVSSRSNTSVLVPFVKIGSPPSPPSPSLSPAMT